MKKKFYGFFILLPFLIFSKTLALAQTACDSIHLADTTFVCPFSIDTLKAIVSGPDSILSIKWSPSLGLTDTTALHTAVTVGATSSWYYFTVQALQDTNLIVNGNFSAGNVGFTSSYSYVPVSPCAICPEGVYAIVTDPNLVHPASDVFGDHTTGTGNMMAINGATTPIDVWCETIPVSPHTNYDFSAWVANWGGADVGTEIPILQFKINGVLIGTPDTTAFPPDFWHPFYATWNSGILTSATVCIYDATTAAGGNDFALDDISFQPICTTIDSIYVDVTPTDTLFQHTDTLVCISAGAVTLTAPAGFSSYLWSTGSSATFLTTSTSGTYWVRGLSGCNEQVDTTHLTILPLPLVHIGDDTTFCNGYSISLTSAQPAGYTYLWNNGSTGTAISVSSTGTYWLQVSNGCLATDTIHITVLPADTTYLSSIDTACANSLPVTLSAPAGFLTFLWNTGATTFSINVNTTGVYWIASINGCNEQVDTTHFAVKALPIVSLGNDTGFCAGNFLTLKALQPIGYTYLWSNGTTGDSIVVSSTGTYWLMVSNGCNITDSIHIIVSPQPIVNLGPDTLVCFANSITLQSSIAYPSPNYLWNTGSTSATITVNTTGGYWLQVSEFNCPGADTIYVTFVHDTIYFNNPDTAICLGKGVYVKAAGSPFADYQWVPTAGIGNSSIINPLILPDTSAEYVLSIIYPGCPIIQDSFFIDVQPNPEIFAGFNRFVCQNDTIHITANVNPNWYTGYSFSWKPGTSVTDSTAQTIVFTDTITRELILTISTPAGCSQKDSVLVTVFPSNFMDSLPNLNFCPGDTAILSPSALLPQISYRWLPPLYLSDSLGSHPVIKPITSVTYLLVGTNQFGCTDSIYFHVNVYPSAIIYLGDSVSIYPGESIPVQIQTNCTQFSWFPAYGLSDPVASNPLMSLEFNTKYIVTGTTSNGCTATDSIMVLVDNESLIHVPNVFTPGNGANNVFKIIKRGVVSLNYMRVYNRWGNLVFETNNIDQGWDGSYKGAPQSIGVYVYSIQAITSTGQLINLEGNVTLLR